MSTIVLSFTYDAWGRILSTTGTALGSDVEIAAIFRYRGYIYDSETGLYYLQTRYYDPDMGRFINQDGIGVIKASLFELTDKNLYAYCDNNPVIRVDHGGDFWMIIGAAVGGLVGGTVSAISQGIENGFDNINWGIVGVNAASGAISGALASTGIGLVASIGINAALGGATYVAEQAIKDEDITVGGVVASTVAGGIGGAIGGKGANSKGLSATWKSASKGIKREMRRTNVKYATKQIAKYTVEKVAVKSSVKIAISRFAFGTIGNTYARYEFGY